MRRFRICEERGSRIDKVVAQVEAYQSYPPLPSRCRRDAQEADKICSILGEMGETLSVGRRVERQTGRIGIQGLADGKGPWSRLARANHPDWPLGLVDV